MTHAHYRTIRLWLAGAAAAMAMASSAGCGQSVQPGRTHHRLYAWNCPSTPNKRAYLVLRYQDEWVDASKSSRVGLIKFQTEPAPLIIDDRYVWGVPSGSGEYVLFDAMRNDILRRTPYVRQIDVGGEAGGESGLLAFADKRSGAVEVVRADGRVVVPAAAGYTDVKLAFQRQDGTAVLALARDDGQWEMCTEQGEVIDSGPMLTTLEFGFAINP